MVGVRSEDCTYRVATCGSGLWTIPYGVGMKLVGRDEIRAPENQRSKTISAMQYLAGYREELREGLFEY